MSTDNTTPPRFADFPLDERIQAALKELGFEEPTPIQAAAMPPLLEGKDMIGRARTGSGKTAAFGLPLLERVKDASGSVRALVLAPTRELALQVTDAVRDFAKKLPVRIVTVYGGASYEPQLRALARGVPVVIGTPGRVIDHIRRGTLDLSHLEMLVLDEADEMLRMGFLEDVEEVLAASPPERQVALFSASMPKQIKKVADTYLREPLEVQVESRSLTTHHIDQRFLVVPPRFKMDALVRVLASETRTSALVFTRTRKGCAEVADELSRRGIGADALHGDLNQGARERVLMRLRAQQLDVVVATDVAARGIDVDHITHVINFDMPEDEAAYTHRIGRTARAGRKGAAITFVMPRERRRIQGIARALEAEITPMKVPSDAAIERARQDRLSAELLAFVEQHPPARLEAWTRELLEDSDSAELLTGALGLLAARAGLHLAQPVSDEPPDWAAPSKAREGREPRTRHPRDNDPSNDAELFFPVGRQKGVQAGNIVAALTQGHDVSAQEIGRITVLDFKSFARVTREVADRLLGSDATVELRGHAVPVTLARAAPPRRPDGDRPARRGPGKPPGNAPRRPPPGKPAGKKRPGPPEGNPAAKKRPGPPEGKPPAKKPAPADAAGPPSDKPNKPKKPKKPKKAGNSAPKPAPKKAPAKAGGGGKPVKRRK